MTTYYHPSCLSSARSCVSGCCQSSGICATTADECIYSYSDKYTNPSKYYYPGYASPLCLSNARNCSTGCCTSSGSCASNTYNCLYQYTDFYTNTTKYYLPVYTTTTNTNGPNNAIGPIAGGVGAGAVMLIVIFVIAYICRKRAIEQAKAFNPSYNQPNNFNGSTIMMTNNSQPVYGMAQPMNPLINSMNPSMNHINPQMMQYGMSQPPQPPFNPIMMQTTFNNPIPPLGMGFAPTPQPGPIIY